MPIINIISLRILVLSLKKLVDMSAKTQALEKVIRENTAVLTDKLQALEKLTKTDTREIQTETEELKGKPTSNYIIKLGTAQGYQTKTWFWVKSMNSLPSV